MLTLLVIHFLQTRSHRLLPSVETLEEMAREFDMFAMTQTKLKVSSLCTAREEFKGAWTLWHYESSIRSAFASHRRENKSKANRALCVLHGNDYFCRSN